MNQWTVSEPDGIVLDESVHSAQVRLIAGTLNVVAAEGPSRIEVTELKGEPLQISLVDGVLTVTYQHLSWSDFGFGGQLKTMDAIKDGFKDLVGSLKRKRRSRAVVTLTLPADAVVKLGSVSADTTVSGLRADTAVYAITGATTLVGLAGKTEANSVSGDVDAQSVGGELKVKTVSGDLTVLAGTATTVRANTVSGAVTLDLAGGAPADVRANTVSGDVAIRLPRPGDTKVEAGSTSGKFSTAFEELTLGGTWGSQRLTGTLGAGSGSLEVTTISGSVSVLARPDDEGPSLVKELTDGSDRTE
ncbi:DUF4097 family beta strand repeat-containing protein [Kitasatospora sp. RB6PN24]|uniref:DUF4097 family beta strand repeat-containing protein n=1 Tax=Kitasatospora humi TaxID=2893891 RepID=UPI001E2E4DB8|nr:DUF4097 family beta strand repeat-containing protein [Kitasatospora humi]MCC9306864.1 DUF4097 family beta strand repeat-containing protein [Kitasatospora humi]